MKRPRKRLGVPIPTLREIRTIYVDDNDNLAEFGHGPLPIIAFKDGPSPRYRRWLEEKVNRAESYAALTAYVLASGRNQDLLQYHPSQWGDVILGASTPARAPRVASAPWTPVDPSADIFGAPCDPSHTARWWCDWIPAFNRRRPSRP